MSGLDIPAIQFNWSTARPYCALSASVNVVFWSDVLSFSSAISDIDAI